MSELSVKVEMNKGRIGVPLMKLTQVSEASLKFFQNLAEDSGFVASKEQWIAKNFGNNCVDYDCAFSEDISQDSVARFNNGLRYLSNFHDRDTLAPFPLRESTIKRFGQIGKGFAPDEVVSFGISSTSGQIEWVHLNRMVVSAIDRGVSDNIKYYSSIQGMIHSFQKESDDPHLTIREQVWGNLIKCYFPEQKYDQIVSLFKDRKAMISIEGEITEDVSEESIVAIDAEDFEVLGEITESDIDAFVGCGIAK